MLCQKAGKIPRKGDLLEIGNSVVLASPVLVLEVLCERCQVGIILTESPAAGLFCYPVHFVVSRDRLNFPALSKKAWEPNHPICA